MRPDRHIIAAVIRIAGNRQRGVSLIAAIMLLLLFSSLVALSASIMKQQGATMTQDVQGARAYQAAKAGIERGVYRIITENVACNGSQTVVFGGTLSAFTVTIEYALAGASPYTEGTATVNICTIKSTAVLTGWTVGQHGYIERQLQVTVN